MLQRGDCLIEMKNFPDSDAEIQQPDAAHRTAYPTGGDDSLQPLNPRLLRGIQEKEVVAPVAKTPHSLRPPRRNRQRQPDLETENNVKNDAKLGRHNQHFTTNGTPLSRTRSLLGPQASRLL